MVATEALLTSESGHYDSLFDKCARFICGNLVDGIYLEFGVFRGRSLADAYKAVHLAFQKQEWSVTTDAVSRTARAAMWKRFRFIGFDSFEGLPAVLGPDADGAHFFEGQFKYSQEIAHNNIIKSGVPPNSFILVKGWFSDILNADCRKRLEIDKVALVHIDCDLYESTRQALDFVRPILADGAIIIFDDWYCFKGNPALGEQKAFAEFTRSMPEWTFVEYQKEGAFRNSFIAVKKRREM